MRALLRADAGVTQGTGHVMRLLTLAEALRDAGHEVLLASAGIDVPWLARAVEGSGVPVVPARRDHLDEELLDSVAPDWVVVDSYQIPAGEISLASESRRVLLFADGRTRGARATMLLDQNLGAEDRPLAGASDAVQLRGARYALVRSAFTGRIPKEPERHRHDPPRVVVVLGGTDADDRTLEIARSSLGVETAASFTFVAQPRQHESLRALAAGRPWRILPPTPELPALLADADVVVSAAGTTAWDVCTLGIPTILLAVVDNQQESLVAALAAGVARGADLVGADLDPAWFARELAAVTEDQSVRARLVAACRARFDGRGAQRVARALAEYLDA